MTVAISGTTFTNVANFATAVYIFLGLFGLVSLVCAANSKGSVNVWQANILVSCSPAEAATVNGVSGYGVSLF